MTLEQDNDLAVLAELSLNSRRAAVLRLVKAGQLSWRRTAIIMAISTEETGMTFGIPRSAALPFDPQCFPFRQSLILERGAEVFNSPLPEDWRDDRDIMDMLRGTDSIITKNGQPMVPIAVTHPPDILNTPNDRLAFIFEWLLDNRKVTALGAWSVGPTQVFLRFGEAPELGNNLFITGRFRSVEHLAQFYFARSVTDLVTNSHFDYLKLDTRSYPTDSVRVCDVGPLTRDDVINDPSIRGCIQTYLQRTGQTGALDWSSARGRNIATQIANAVQNIWQLARSMGIDVNAID